MENNDKPVNENTFHKIRSALGALKITTEKEETMSVLVDQLLQINSAMESIYKAVSIASPAFMHSGIQVNADNKPDAETSRLLASHTSHLTAHDQHLAAHDDHLITLSERINMLNRT